MRVLFVINTMGRGGAEVQVRDLALRLVREGHTVAIVVLLPYEDFEDQLRAGGVETFTLRMTKGVPRARAIMQMASIARRFRPDVVHAHLFGAILLTRVAFALPRKILGSPVVVGTSHARHERSRGRYRFYRATSGLTDAFTCVSKRGIEEHERSGAARPGTMHYTPNGIDVSAFEGLETLRVPTRRSLGVADSFVWLALGSFRDEDKDFGTMLHAFAQARSGDDQLVIAGEGRLLDEKRALASALGIAPHTHFLGLRSDVRGLLAAADGYVLSSLSEAMPIVLLEAGAAQVPVIATDVGDVDQIIIHEKNGYLVPSKDAGSFAAAMRRLRGQSPAMRKALGVNGKAHVAERFDFANVVRRWVELYEQCEASLRN